jgi:choline monooxygenase
MTSLESALTLPAKVYCDAEVVRDERDAIFRRHWQYVGYESQLPAVGASLFSEVAGTPLVIVRTREGLRAYEAVCRHRAGPLEACHAGGEHFLRCRYHGWSYGHDGALINATEMQGCKDFEPGEVRLPAIELANLQGLIFARLRSGPVDFDALIAGIHERVVASGHELARLQHHATVSYDIDCNWKTYVDNFLEGYHVPLVHPSLNAILDYRSYRTELAKWYSLQSSPLDSAPNAYGSGEALYYFLYPATMLNILPDRLQTNRVVPINAQRCRVIFDFFYPREWTAEARALKYASDAAFSEQVQQEDIEICIAVQRNLASGSYVSGRLNPKRERGLLHFQQLWLNDMSSS